MTLQERDREQFKFHASLEFAGLSCNVHANSRLLLSSLLLWQTKAKPAGNAVELCVTVDYEAVPGPNAPVELRFPAGYVAATFHGNEVFTFDIQTKTIRATVSSETAQDERFWSVELLPLILEIFGPQFGIFPLRGACVARDGAGILILGPAGCGKTSLSIALAQLGFDHVSGERTYLQETPAGLNAFGMLVPVKLPLTASQLFPELRSLAKVVLPWGDSRLDVEPASTFNVTQASRCVPKVVVFLEHAGAGHGGVRLSEQQCRSLVRDELECASRGIADEEGFLTGALDAVSSLEFWSFQIRESPKQSAAALEKMLAPTFSNLLKATGD